VYRYDRQSPLLPSSLSFTIASGGHLLSSNKDGFYNYWSYHHSPYETAKHIFDLAIKDFGSSLGITADTPLNQCYRRLCLKFHPDKIEHKYHSVYRPFLHNTQSILQAAWTVIEYETDLPDLIFSSDSDNDESNVQPPATLYLALPTQVSFSPDHDIGIVSGQQLSIDDTVDDTMVSRTQDDTIEQCADISEECSILHNSDSRLSLNSKTPSAC
jgi:hypothetical protein